VVYEDIVTSIDSTDDGTLMLALERSQLGDHVGLPVDREVVSV